MVCVVAQFSNNLIFYENEFRKPSIHRIIFTLIFFSFQHVFDINFKQRFVLGFVMEWLQNGSKMMPGAPKVSPGAPKMSPGAPKVTPGAPKGSKNTKKGSKSVRKNSKKAQERIRKWIRKRNRKRVFESRKVASRKVDSRSDATDGSICNSSIYIYIYIYTRAACATIR